MILKYVKPASQTLLAWFLLNFIGQVWISQPDPETKESINIMIVKPAITWLNRVNDANLRNNTGTILKMMADNAAIYDDPAPALDKVQTALDNFVGTIGLAADGGKSATAAKKAARKVLTDLVRLLASYVSVACKGDRANLILSGFPTHKPVREPVGQLPKPQGLTVKHGPQRGDLTARVKPVKGAVNYNWRIIANLPGAVPVIVQDTASTHVFNSLTAGVCYTVDVSVLGTAGPTDWCSPASLFAD